MSRRLDLAGVAEAAELLGVSKRRVRELQQVHSDFPAPAAELRAGPVWLRPDLVAWAAKWPRRTGRPRKKMRTA